MHDYRKCHSHHQLDNFDWFPFLKMSKIANSTVTIWIPFYQYEREKLEKIAGAFLGDVVAWLKVDNEQRYRRKFGARVTHPYCPPWMMSTCRDTYYACVVENHIKSWITGARECTIKAQIFMIKVAS